MKIFEWMQNKITGRHKHKGENPASASNYLKHGDPEKEEFGDWSHGLLAIGTFGNNEDLTEEHSSISQDHPLQEEVGQLQSELNLILHDQQGFEAERTTEDDDDDDDDADDVEQSSCNKIGGTSLVVSRGKDNNVCLDSPTSSALIGKKSFSFLLKKVFACRGGFTPASSLKDQIPDSRMDKLLRSILHKKIYPQTSASTLSSKKYLENRNMKTEEEPGEGRSRWVKTDSEYIVLEI